MPKLNIAQRLALLAAAVALIMTVALCLLSFLKGRAVLTDHEVANLADEGNLRMFEIREEFRYLSREVRDVAAQLPKLPEGQSLTEHVHAPEFDAAWQRTFTRILDRVNEHARQSPWNWVDREIVLEAYCLSIEPAGGTKRLCGLSRDGARIKDVDLVHPLADAALADLQGRVGNSSVRVKGGPLRQYMSRVLPATDSPARRALCIGFEFAGERGEAAGVFVVAFDFTQMIANQARHSPRHLFFVADAAGRFLVHPVESKVGAAVREDLDSKGSPRFDFKLAPWAAEQSPSAIDLSSGETQMKGSLDDALKYYFCRKQYEGESPFRTKAQRDALAAELDRFAQNHEGFRFSRPRAESRDIALSSPDRAALKEAQRLIANHEKTVEYKGGGDWEGPVECSTFAAHVVPLRIGMEPTGADDPGDTLYLIVASSLEEIAHDISQATRWVWWSSLLLCVGAAWLALIPAHLLTRPLLRITRAAQKLAEGNYATDLPVKSPGEIGELARAFRHMAEQIRQRDEALRDTLARMQAVLRTAADGIITFNDRGIIEEWNQAAEQIFGFSAKEIMGEKVQRLMEIPTELAGGGGDSLLGGTVRALSKVISTPSMIRQGRRRDGSTFWMEVAFSEVPIGDRRLTTGIFRDVTRRVQDEERIRQMNELLEARVRVRTGELQDAKSKLEVALQAAQSASQAKDVFVRTISHELRTPLSAVKGFTELLLNPKAAKLRENPLPTLQKIHSASEYLLTLINDLLDVARFTAGEQIHLNHSDFDLDPFFSGIVEMTNPLLKRNNNRLSAEPAANLGRMRADETRVRQILLNLLSNACKFTENGAITFNAMRQSSDGGDWIVFTVADTGNGMTPEQMKDLFKPFYRVDNSITRKHGGTGLGLSISKLLCERMGGSIEVASEPGKGSTFVVRIPAKALGQDEPAPFSPAVNGSSSPKQENTVLVIDDDPLTQDMMQSFLTREGFAVHLASSGDEGVRLAREARPAAITLDVMMPGFDGWAVLTALKSDPRTLDIPVIMLTVAEDRSRGFTLGASDYVTKPIDWNRLSEILRKYCATVLQENNGG
jgi:PAS domain S-box-containing protein